MLARGRGVASAGETAFGELLKRYRESAHLSQADLAARAGLSRRGISDLERGARRAPQRETTRRLMDGLGLSEPQRSLFLDAARDGHFVTPGAQLTSALPFALSSFVGREREVEDVVNLLQTARLLTLTGIGGIGKTRVALNVARRLQAEYADGVALVDLSSLGDANPFLQTVATALGLRERPGEPIARTLIDCLRDRQTLIVLDNCEHLLDACALFAEESLRACGELRILATSREPLGVAGETRWTLPPMYVPTGNDASAAELAASEAVRLFYERARALDAGLKLTHENLLAMVDICRRLDGLPLAIELAATWVTVLPTMEIARRVDSRLPVLARGSRTAQPRQQTLRASLDWSFDLLSEPQAALFQRLSVFAGGWTLEAAESVCAEGPVRIDDLLGTLSQLVDKSLVQVDASAPRGRYRFLETVRQYAREKLQASGEAARVSANHAAYFVNLAAQATSQLSGPPDSGRQVELALEHDNLRATVRCVLANADVQAAHVLGTALARFSQIGNHLTEGRAWLADILALSDEPTAGRARTLIGAGLLGAYQGDYAFAEACLADGVSLCRALGEDRELAHGLFALGLMAWTRGDHEAAGRFGAEGLAVSGRAGHKGFQALHLFICAAAAAEEGDRVAARRLAEQCHMLATHARFGRAIGLSLGVLGLLRWLEADYQAADALLEQAIQELYHAGIPVAVAWAMSLRARVAAAQSNHAQALELSIGAVGLVKSFNLKGRAPFVLRSAEVMAGDGQPERAVLLAAAADAIRRRIGTTAPPMERAHVSEWMGPVRRSLGPRADELWERGVRLSLDDAVTTALASGSLARGPVRPR